MYNLFAHKGLNDSNPFVLTKIIKKYIDIAKPEIIIVSPGYLSTKPNTTRMLLNDILLDWYQQDQHKLMGITAGMNGVNKQGSPINLINHWQELTNRNVRIIEFMKSSSYATNKDHKKMVFFADFLYPECNFGRGNVTIDISNIDMYIDKIKVKAISAGSSNFSKQTYIGNRSGTADKGEADIFMYSKEANGANSNFHGFLLESLESTDLFQYNDDIIPPMLSESLRIGNIPPHSSNIFTNELSPDEKYLTWMLYETLKDQLS